MGTLPSYSQALESAIGVVEKTSNCEKVKLNFALDRLLAADIIADRNLPPYNRSQMDGFAVVASEVGEGTSMEVVGQIAAGSSFEGIHTPQTCVSIATGAPVPDCFDAVVQHELTDNGSKMVTFHCSEVQKGKSIHPCGVDAKTGEVLVMKHTKLSPQHIGIAASVGLHEIDVITKPKVIVLTSGDEVVEPNEQPLPHQIRNGNNPMLTAAFSSMGCDVIETHHILDDPEETNEAIAQAIDGRCDLLVTIGGISAGKRDFFPEAFSNCEVELVVKGAKIQPGKPVIVGKHENAIVLGLPGNPVSALACSCVFGWPIVRVMQGISATLPWQEAPLGAKAQPNPNRLCFRPCQLYDGKVTVPNWQGSGDLAHTSKTDGLVQLPSSKEELCEGDLVSCLAFPWYH
jgi:molybdopterin molybdotransferase